MRWALDFLPVSIATSLNSLQKIDALETRLDQTIDTKIDGLRAELATQFRWTIGVMTALFTAVLAAILTR